MFSAPLVSPRWDSPDDVERADDQLVRAQILRYRFDELAADYFREAFGEANAARLGLPDTTLAPLAYQTAQLTTPGLYLDPPEVKGATDSPAYRAMLDPDAGALAACGYWSRMVSVMYMTVGIGAYALRVSTEGQGDTARAVLRSVNPHRLSVDVSANDPMREVVLREHVLRTHIEPDGKHKQYWYLDTYDIRDPAAPSYTAVRLGERRPVDRKADLDPAFADEPYPWMDPSGAPYIPYVIYRAADTGEYWPDVRRGLKQGTLRAIAYWTLCSHAALWAQGNANFIGGVDPDVIPADIRRGDRNRDEHARPIAHFDLVPGTANVLPVEDGKQLQLLAATTGIDLAQVANFANLYHMLLASLDGLSPSDATRKSANPTSGAALAISQSDKRAFAAAVMPFFRNADKRAIKLIAWQLSRATGMEHAADGYSIRYRSVPLSPDEQLAIREQLTWESENGQRSPIDVHLALNPTKTREQALEDLIQARVDSATIEAMVTKRLAALGIDGMADEPVAEE